MVGDLPMRPFTSALPGDGPVLQRVCTATLELLDVTGAVVAVMTDQAGGGAVASAGSRAVEVFDLHLDLGEGPCRDAHDTGREVLAGDLAGDDGVRWPGFTEAAIGLGVGSVFALPARLGAMDVGVLHLQRDRAAPLTLTQLGDARRIAELCTTMLIDHQAGLEDDSGSSDGWPNRVVVHQATGMVSVQLGASLATSLARLRAYAFAQDRALEDVARDIVDRSIRMEP